MKKNSLHNIIDAHAHLGDSVFDADRDEVIQKSLKAGIIKIISVSETLEEARRNLELAETYRQLCPAAGLYPSQLDFAQADELISFIRINKDRLCAIGEVGLDFWLAKDEIEQEKQRKMCGQFIDLSLELDLPLNIHSRSAGRATISLLLEKGAKKVQLHAFDGKTSAAMPAVEAGYYFSIPPSIVRSPQKQKLVRQLPLSCLLVETDSPVLGIDPQSRNEPAHIIHSIEAIAQIKGISQAAVRQVSLENTIKLYGESLL